MAITKQKRAYLEMFEPAVAAELPPDEMTDEKPKADEMKMPGPGEIDAEIEKKAKALDKLAAKDDEAAGEDAMESKRIVRLLTTYGPPEEWDAVTMEMLGEDKCEKMRAAWEKMPAAEKTDLLRAYESEEHAESYGGKSKVPAAAIVLTKEE